MMIMMVMMMMMRKRKGLRFVDRIRVKGFRT
jgi:hypothetical protein